MCSLLSELTVPSTADGLNSLDDLLKSALPIHTRLHIEGMGMPFGSTQSKLLLSKIHKHAEGSASFEGLINVKRRDMTYIVPRYLFSALFWNMPYKILPRASINAVIVPFRLNRPSPYGRLFEIAFMRAMEAGAVGKVWRNRRLNEYYYIRGLGGGGDNSLEANGPQPLSLIDSLAFFLWPGVWDVFWPLFLSFLKYV